MSVPIIKTSFVAGEVSPKLFGHVDLVKFSQGASTFRNGFVGYQGGYYSRAGTAFVGFSKQTGRNYPPRLITFQFSINQGLALEFGHQYMRVVSDGGFVLENPISIVGASQADPGVLTFADFSVSAASSNNGSVSASYAPGDTVTPAGGTGTAAVLGVTSTALTSIAVDSPGDTTDTPFTLFYQPGDTIILGGGAYTTSPVLAVTTTQVIAAYVYAPISGGGGTPGPATVTGTTGTGTPFQADVTIGAGGNITAVNSIVTGGSYTENPPYLPHYGTVVIAVSGGSLSGAYLFVVMGVGTVAIQNPGVFTTNALSFTQLSSSGQGVGATFNTPLFGPNALSIVSGGNYSVFPTSPAAQAATSGTGAGATFNLTEVASTLFSTGDWLLIDNVVGMTELNTNTYVVTQLSPTTFSLQDVYGNNIDTTAFGAYVSGGTASRIFTLPTIYNEQDLLWLKFVQSADTMTICCVNQQTSTEYVPQDLTRMTDTSWTFTSVVPTESVQAPTNAAAATSSSGTTDYQYQVTAVDPIDGTESVPSNIAEIDMAVDVASTAGTISVTWSPSATPGVNEYNVYKATPTYDSTTPPVGALFGFAGSVYGASFADSNVVADFTQVPPQHQNPFARGQVIGATVDTPGSGITTATAAISSGTGSGAVIVPLIESGALVAFIVENNGQNYQDDDTIVFTVTGGGAVAPTATPIIGAQMGTYPSVPNYFQERRALANSLNNPDTYWMSQPGAFTNFDFRVPTIASDAITGSPWSLQVNGIQAMLQTSGGLLVLTGLQAWLLVGQGSFATNVQAISPSSQVANRQPATGCSPTVPPILINYDVIYVQAKGSYYLDLPYQLYALSEPIDLTENSSQLFLNYTIREHAWCEQPYKIIWSVRNDGVMLSLTYYKTQQVAGWGRHDTQGLFQSVCSVTELPVDALYTAVQRFPAGKNAYMIERMDNRIWTTAEDCWCVDSGLALPLPEPDATITASSASGLGACSGVTDLMGGIGYSAGTTAAVVDDNGEGPGAGATPALTIAGGVITAISFAGNEGTGYVSPKLVFTDPAGTAGGSGASAQITLDNSAAFSTSAAVFDSGSVGSVIRMGGGLATITAFTDSQHVTADISVPITQLLQDDDGTSLPQTFGNWTLAAPVSRVTGLFHLIGATVTGLADGNVITPRVVDAEGGIDLDVPASSVVVGLGFTAQLQSVYLDAGDSPTVQGQRKKIAAVTVRTELSRGVVVGSNQPDGSTLSPPQIASTWEDLEPLPDKGVTPYNSSTEPLFTGDSRVPIQGGFQTPGQVCLQQSNPLPMSILALVPEVLPGDNTDLKATPVQQGRR